MSGTSRERRGLLARLRRNTGLSRRFGVSMISQTRPATASSPPILATTGSRPASADALKWAMEDEASAQHRDRARYLETVRARSWPLVESDTRALPASRLTVTATENRWWSEDVTAAIDEVWTKVNRRHDSHSQAGYEQGFLPPPPQEVEEYSRKALPSTPSTGKSTAGSSMTLSRTRAGSLSARALMRTSVAVSAAAVDKDEHIYRSESVAPELKWHTRNHMISEQQSTWVSRVESRARNDQRSRELLRDDAWLA